MYFLVNFSLDSRKKKYLQDVIAIHKHYSNFLLVYHYQYIFQSQTSIFFLFSIAAHLIIILLLDKNFSLNPTLLQSLDIGFPGAPESGSFQPLMLGIKAG